MEKNWWGFSWGRKKKNRYGWWSKSILFIRPVQCITSCTVYGTGCQKARSAAYIKKTGTKSFSLAFRKKSLFYLLDLDFKVNRCYYSMVSNKILFPWNVSKLSDGARERYFFIGCSMPCSLRLLTTILKEKVIPRVDRAMFNSVLHYCSCPFCRYTQYFL